MGDDRMEFTSPAQEELIALAASHRIRQRPRPYLGDSVQVPLGALGPADGTAIQELYQFLCQLLRFITPQLDDGMAMIGSLREFLVKAGYEVVMRRIHDLGATLEANETPLALRKIYHDIRGCGLPALVMHLDMVLAGEAQAQDLGRIFLLCRDQLKIIRNALPDVDPAGYARDLESNEHSTTLLLDKWSTAIYRLRGAEVALTMRCEFEGSISERCMEFAALDRVVYNLVNNAARFAADGKVDLNIFAIDEDGRGPARDETDLRFVVMNRLHPHHGARIRADLGDDLSSLFGGGYTTGGHGLGLSICGDFVTDGYGLPSLHTALANGYLGARIIRDTFLVWFHWPARRSAAWSAVSLGDYGSSASSSSEPATAALGVS